MGKSAKASEETITGFRDAYAELDLLQARCDALADQYDGRFRMFLAGMRQILDTLAESVAADLGRVPDSFKPK